MEAGIRDRIARREIVRAVGNDVVLADEFPGIVGGEADGVGRDRHVRVDPGDCVARARDFRPAKRRRVVNDLALQVGQRDRVVIDDPERPHPGRGEILDKRRTQPAGADDQHPRRLQLLLPRTADIGKHDMARVAGDLVRRRVITGM